MPQKFYLTTPVYYVNDVPHIGHSYTTIAADVLARYKRIKGFDVYFLTGTDEHGQKVFSAAEKNNMQPQEFVDSVVVRFKEAWKTLLITYTDLIRTTEERHAKVVQDVFLKLLKDGFIYKGEYKGLYCTTCETYVQDEKTHCPDCGRKLESVKEESYFFKLSSFQDELLKYYDDNPSFILPNSRKNEIVNFVKSGLYDLSITRISFPWGIKVPSDPKHVVYVWFDALINYISALGYPDNENFKKYWPADVHLMGKEIVRFHAVIWPAMLMALQLPLPRKIFGHGWWTVEGEKMSKSKGNVVDPIELSNKFGVEAFRYFVLREVPFGADGDFSMQAFIARYNADLANDLGNLLSRTLTMIEKYFNGIVPDVKDKKHSNDDLSSDLLCLIEKSPAIYDDHLENLGFSLALETIWHLISSANQYIEKKAPWALAKEGKTDDLSCVLFDLFEVLRVAAILVAPFMPQTARIIWDQLNLPQEPEKSNPSLFGMKIAGTVIRKGSPLFPRFQK